MTREGYVVRAGNANELIDDFESNSLVAIGWSEAGDVSEYSTYEEGRARR